MVGVEHHARAAGAVVVERVDVERGDRAVLVRREQVRRRRAGGRPRRRGTRTGRGRAPARRGRRRRCGSRTGSPGAWPPFSRRRNPARPRVGRLTQSNAAGRRRFPRWAEDDRRDATPGVTLPWTPIDADGRPREQRRATAPDAPPAPTPTGRRDGADDARPPHAARRDVARALALDRGSGARARSCRCSNAHQRRAARRADHDAGQTYVADRPWLDILYQATRIALALVPVLLVSTSCAAAARAAAAIGLDMRDWKRDLAARRRCSPPCSAASAWSSTCSRTTSA